MFLSKSIEKVFLIVVVVLAGLQSTALAGGLPGENLLTLRWRDMIANHSPLTNAALLTEENYPSFRIAFSPILNGSFLHTEMGLTYPIGLYQSLGLTFVGEFDGNINGSRDNNGVLEEDPGIKSSNNNYVVMGTYAYQFWNRFSLGLNFDIVYQTNFGTPLTGVGVDAGITYRLLRNPIWGDHLLGIALQNLIAPKMSNTLGLSLDSKGQYSRDLRFTWLSYYMEHRLESTLDYDIKDIFASIDEFKIDSVGSAKVEWDVNYKIGVWLLKLIRVYLQLGVDADGLDYWGMAFGANIPGVNNGRDLEVMYQINVMTANDNDAKGHTVYLRVNMGKHREEVWARKMARMASLSPNDLYNKARKLYFDKKYWDAFFVFSRLAAEFPDFFKNDWVEYYRGSCEEELDMRDAAIKNYQKMHKEYPLSSATPYGDLGLMRVLYRNGDYSGVETQYSELVKPTVPDSLRFHAVYLMGETFLQQNNPDKAIDALSKIPDGHPDYAFAQHAIAVSHALLNHESSQIVEALENCVGTKARTDAEKEIINRSYLFLGYVFYEENTLSKAIVSLRMVPTTSIYNEDALLGQGWTSLKARQWTDCITVGQMLQKSTNKEALKCEGMLLEAYGHLLQNDYAVALDILKDASDKIRAVKAPDQDSLNYAKLQYDSDRMGYNKLAENTEDLSVAGQTVATVNQIDSLHTKQMDFVKKFKSFYALSDNFQRTTFFSRNVQTIKEDIEYALATVQKIAGQKGVQKAQEKIDDKQKAIDSEIEKLKNQMDKMQEKGK